MVSGLLYWHERFKSYFHDIVRAEMPGEGVRVPRTTKKNVSYYSPQQMNYVGARIVIPTQVHHTSPDCDYEVLTNG